ncbi:MAG: glycosyltransferase, partial [Clostridia bacterium]|nr:glycosyltransferase [Clostridia bacterium]
VVMPNGTPDIQPDDARMQRAAAKLALPDGPILLYCGQINWKKNILRILEASALAAAGGLDFTLVLAGQGPDAQAIADKAAELGLSERLRFTGHIQDEELLYGLYQRAALFLFPSLYDTSGMVVREAAAMATPSVVVAGSAAAEPIRDSENGFLCSDSARGLAAVIEEALADPDKTAAAGLAARESIYLSWDRIIDDALARYRALAGAGSADSGAGRRTGRAAAIDRARRI